MSGVHHANHRLTIHRAADQSDLVVALAGPWVAGLQLRGPVRTFQVLMLEQVEPEPAAAGAAIHFDAHHRDRSHRRLAFGAAERAGLAQRELRFGTVVHAEAWVGTSLHARGPDTSNATGRTWRVASNRPA